MAIFHIAIGSCSGVETTLTLRDGRVLSGDYDEHAGTLTMRVGKGKAQVQIDPSDIIKRQDEPEAPVAPEESTKDNAEKERQAEIDRQKKVELQRKLEAIQAEERQQVLQQEGVKRAHNRALYWQSQGYSFSVLDLTADQIDARGAAFARAAYWHMHGYEFDPMTTTSDQMDQRAAALIQKAKEARDEEEQARIDREEEIKERDRIEKERREAQARQDAENRAAADQAEQVEQERRSQEAYDKERNRMEEEASQALYREQMAIFGVILVVAIVLWILPALVARRRRHRNYTAIAVLCLVIPFAGGAAAFIGNEITRSIIGALEISAWVIALIWSLYRSEKDEIEYRAKLE